MGDAEAVDVLPFRQTVYGQHLQHGSPQEHRRFGTLGTYSGARLGHMLE